MFTKEITERIIKSKMEATELAFDIASEMCSYVCSEIDEYFETEVAEAVFRMIKETLDACKNCFDNNLEPDETMNGITLDEISHFRKNIERLIAEIGNLADEAHPLC